MVSELMMPIIVMIKCGKLKKIQKNPSINIVVTIILKTFVTIHFPHASLICASFIPIVVTKH